MASQEMACFPAEEAVISVSRLINPRVSCFCTLPAIWLSQQNPAGHSSSQRSLPDALKAVGCPPVEKQIVQIEVGTVEVKGSLHPNLRSSELLPVSTHMSEIYFERFSCMDLRWLA